MATASYTTSMDVTFSDRRRRWMKTSPMHAPLRFTRIRVQIRFRRARRAKDVNGRRRAVFMIRSVARRWTALCSASCTSARLCHVPRQHLGRVRPSMMAMTRMDCNTVSLALMMPPYCNRPQAQATRFHVHVGQDTIS